MLVTLWARLSWCHTESLYCFDALLWGKEHFPSSGWSNVWDFISVFMFNGERFATPLLTHNNLYFYKIWNCKNTSASLTSTWRVEMNLDEILVKLKYIHTQKESSNLTSSEMPTASEHVKLVSEAPKAAIVTIILLETAFLSQGSQSLGLWSQRSLKGQSKIDFVTENEPNCFEERPKSNLVSMEFFFFTIKTWSLRGFFTLTRTDVQR